jgi:peroxiredoxin
MSQAEIAGGTVTPAHELPSKGRRIPDFGLISTEGKFIQLSDYRGIRNLVLILADGRNSTKEFLSEVNNRYDEIKAEEGEVLTVVEQSSQTQRESKASFPILIDKDGYIHREFGAVDQLGQTAAAVYVTDRYGEVYDAHRSRDGQSLPRVNEILASLEFINIQCPECAAPEWPV